MSFKAKAVCHVNTHVTARNISLLQCQMAQLQNIFLDGNNCSTQCEVTCQNPVKKKELTKHVLVLT